MRVLAVIDSLAQGGAERSLVATAPVLPERGIDLEVVTLFDRPGLGDELVQAGTRVHPAFDDRSRTRAIRRLRLLITERQPDLVHTTLFEADITGRCAAALARRPVVSSLVNTAYGPTHPRRGRFGTVRVRSAQALDIATARVVRRFHAVSHVVADTMARRLLVPRSRIDVVWRGRNPAAIGTLTPERRARAREMLALPADARVAVMLARHERDKGIDVAVEALDVLRASGFEMTLVVAGREGNETTSLRRATARAGIDGAVRLLGHRDDPIEVMCAGDVLLAPSRREGLPGTILEAMALGIPIVASDLGTVREAVGDGTHALLVRVDDGRELARAVRAAFDQPDLTATRVQRARDRFERHFTIEAAADGMAAFYERALTSARRRL